MEISLGQVVYSKTGRDSKRKLIVVGIIDELYVLISDGDLRRIEKPKKKKVKHLEFTSDIIESISEKLRNKYKVSNLEIRKALEVKDC